MDFNDYQVGAAKEHFWFKAKRGLIDFLLKKTVLDRNCKILNVGAGTGEDLEVIKKFGNVYAIDLEKKAIDCIPDNLVFEKKVADVLSIPYEDNFFDIIVSFDVLEHIKEDQKAVKEILRVLKPGGSFVFTVPAYNFIYSGHDKKLNHFRRYNKKTITNLLKDFSDSSLGYWFFSFFVPVAVLRLFETKISSQRRIPSFLNKLAYKILSLENWLMSKGLRFPFGLTIWGQCKKE